MTSSVTTTEIRGRLGASYRILRVRRSDWPAGSRGPRITWQPIRRALTPQRGCGGRHTADRSRSPRIRTHRPKPGQGISFLGRRLRHPDRSPRVGLGHTDGFLRRRRLRARSRCSRSRTSLETGAGVRHDPRGTARYFATQNKTGICVVTLPPPGLPAWPAQCSQEPECSPSYAATQSRSGRPPIRPS